MINKDQDKGSGNRVPTWDGRPESFFHYVTEIKWHLAGTKASERPYAAARLVRRILESDYPALKSLMYKLNPEEFTTEEAVSKLVSFLEASPMNRQPIPDAGRKLSAYYRRLSRKPQETIPQFLVREETLYDEMWRSLQRLLREKELDFTQYDCSLSDLKSFCGIDPEQSFYVPNGSTGQDSDTTGSGSTHPSRFGGTRPRAHTVEHEDDEEFDEDHEDPPTPRSRSHSSPTPIGAPPYKPPSKKYDLIERLMQKGLIPLAALDIIRGWLLLECTSATELDKSLVKAATQNKLGYQSIRSALLSLHEDRGKAGHPFPKGMSKGKHSNFYAEDMVDPDSSYDGFYGESFEDPMDSWYDWGHDYSYDGFFGEEGYVAETPEGHAEEETPSSSHQGPDDEAVHALTQLQEEEKELAAMMADHQRNLEQARKAVQEAKKDRGWKSTPTSFSKGSPPHGNQKGTSTFMRASSSFGKGKPSFANNYVQRGSMYKGKGKSTGWRPPYPGFQPRPGPRPPGNFSYQNNMYMESPDYQIMTMMDIIPETDFTDSQQFFPMDGQRSSPSELMPDEAIIDSGATVSAGGQDAVAGLVEKLARTRPDMSVTIVKDDRPYFRYGSGSWGQALYKLKLHFGQNITLQIYALPSPGVPVLVGMREMQQLHLVLNATNGHAILLGQNRKLRLTQKRQILLNFSEDIPREDNVKTNPDVTSTATIPRSILKPGRKPFSTSEGTVGNRRHATFVQSAMMPQHNNYMLEFFDEPNTFPMFVVQESQDSACFPQNSFSHLQISQAQMQFLFGDSVCSGSVSSLPTSPPNSSSVTDGGESRVPQVADRRSSSRCPEGSEAEISKESRVQEGAFGSRSYSQHGHAYSRSSSQQESMAVHGGTHSVDLQQSIRKMDRLPHMRSSSGVCSREGTVRTINTHGSSSQCDCSFGTSQDGRIQAGASGSHIGQEDDQVHCGSGSFESSQETSREEHGQETPSGNSHSFRRGVPGAGRSRSSSCREEEKGSSKIFYTKDRMKVEPHVVEGPSRTSVSGALRTSISGALRTSISGAPNASAEFETEFDEHHDSTPEDVLSRLSESLKDAVFHIDQQLQALQQQHFLLWEICCSPSSTLTAEVHKNNLRAKRWTLENGFDLEKPDCVSSALEAVQCERPSKLWAALKCTPWTSIQNLNQKTPQQVSNLRRMRLRSRKQVRHVIQIFKTALQAGPDVDIYFEWPKGAKDGWSLQELRDFETWCKNTLKRDIFFTQIDGCMVGLRDDQGMPINKPWLIMTTDRSFHINATILCDGSHTHRQILGLGTKAVASTGFYPRKMAQRVVQVWKKEMFSQGQPQILQELHTISAAQDIYAMDAQKQIQQLEEFHPAELKRSFSQMEGSDEVNDQQMEEENVQQETIQTDFPISSDEREKGKSILHRLHRAAGHPSNRSLARLIRDRKLPKWLVDEALNLQCPHCIATQSGNQMVLNKSIGEHPRPWQIVGMDVMEVIFPQQQSKTRFLLMTCLTMNFAALIPLWTGSISATGTDSGAKIIDAFCNGWLAHRPRPEWVMVDAQTSFIKGDFPLFLQTAGIGLLAAPGEGHWIHGKTEAMVKVLKRTMKRIRHEHPMLAPSINAALAVYANNHAVRTTGFSPIQWAYGYDPDELERKNDPLQANAEKNFSPKYFQEFQQMRYRAMELHRQESARDTVTRLWNSAPRALVDYKVGDFVCIWRTMTLKARKRTLDYNPEARFFGPGRIVMIEPPIVEGKKEAIIWVLCGATLYRCAREQLRPATEQETLLEILRSGEILVKPRSELLAQLRSFVDVAGQPHTPDHSEYQQQEQDRNQQRPEGVASLRTRWNQLVSINENRRQEGLPPLMQLPANETRRTPEVFHLSDNDVDETQQSPELDTVDKFMNTIHHLDTDTQLLVMQKIRKLETENKYNQDSDLIRQQIQRDQEDESHLMHFIQMDFEKVPKDRQWVYQVVFDVDEDLASAGNPFMYVKRVLESKNTEISYKQLSSEDIPLFDEAKAREVAEVMGSLALRAISSHEEKLDAESHPERHIPMRWVLTWKPLIPPEPPEPGKPTTAISDGSKKAKARVVLLGFRHPDLVKRHPITGQPELRTAAPTISRTGRNLLLQCFAFDEHRMESADAKSAFLQADNVEESRRIWTTAVPELARAHNVRPGELLRVLGAINLWLDKCTSDLLERR